jgi:hypothetical protein
VGLGRVGFLSAHKKGLDPADFRPSYARPGTDFSAKSFLASNVAAHWRALAGANRSEHNKSVIL